MNPSQPSFDFFGALNNFSPLFVNKPHMSDLELGDKFYQEGRYPRAYEHYKVHLEKVVNSQNPNIYDLAAAYKKAGMASLEAAKFADAHHFLTQALLVMEKIEDGEPYLFVEVLNKIGDAFLEEGKFIEAEKSFQDGFDSILKHYGDDHFSVAACFNRYGNLREKQQKHQEAIDYLKKAIEIGEKYLEDKAELAMSYNHLARVCACLKQFDDSFACIDKALQLNTELYGDCHPEIARCYNTYGNALINQGKFTEALEYHRKSLNMAKEFLGEEHPRVAISYNNIGLLYFQLGQYDESLANYKMSCQIRGKCRIEYNPNALDTFFNVGVILEKQQKYKQALEFYKRALDVCIKIFGEDHIALSDCYCRIANLLKKEGNFTEAEIVCEKMMDIKKRTFGKDSIKVGMSYHCIGTVYHENKKYKKATECYINSYKIVSAQPTRDIEREAGCFHNISLVNTVFKDLKTMESMVSKSIKAYGSAFGKSSQQAQEANMRKRNIEKRRCLLDNNCDFNF